MTRRSSISTVRVCRSQQSLQTRDWLVSFALDIPLDLGDATPNGQRALALKFQADGRLLESLEYLIIQAGKGLGTYFSDSIDALRIAKNSHDQGILLCSGAYAIHSELAWAMRYGDARGVNRIVQSIRAEDLEHHRLLVWPYGQRGRSKFVANCLDRVMRTEHVREYGISYDARAPRVEDVPRLTFTVERVLADISLLDSETRSEIDYLITDVALIASREINAGTSFRAHGLVLLRELGPDREWTAYLENLVHEAAHLYLYLVWTEDEVIRNDRQESFASPLRPGGRPLSAIFHAMFVLARTFRVIRIFRAKDEHREAISRMSTSYNYSQNPAAFEEKFLETFETIRMHARLTSVGQALLDSCRAVALGQ